LDLATAPCFSPDGKTIAVADSRSVRLWDVATGSTIWRALIMGPPQKLLFSPDGATLAIGDEWRIRCLNAKTGRLQNELDHRAPGDRVAAMAFSRDGRWLAVAGASNTVTVWDAASGDRLMEFDSVEKKRILDLACSDDGANLTAMAGNHVRVWDWSKKVILSDAKLSLTSIHALHLARDGQRVAIVLVDWTVLVETKTGRELLAVSADGKRTWEAALSQDGKRLATVWDGENGYVVRISDVETGKRLKAIIVGRAGGGTVQFSPDARSLLTAGAESAVRIWNVETGHQTNALPAHDRKITALAFTPDGSTIISGSHDGTIRIWDAATGEHRRQLPSHRSSVNALVVTPDGSAVLSCGGDAVVPMRDLTTGKEIRRFDLRLPPERPDPTVPHQVISLALSADGTRLSAYSRAEGDERAAYHVWETATAQSLARRGFSRSPNFLQFASDGHSVLEYVCPPNAKREFAQNMPLALCDLVTGRFRMLMPQPDEFDFRHALTQDGLTMATATSKSVPRSMDENEVRYTIRLWDLPTGKEYLTKGSDREGLAHPVEAMAFSPDGRWLATAHSNRSVIVWSAQTGRDEMTITGMDALTKCLAFSPDGRRLVTGHTDSTALIWAVAIATPTAPPPSKLVLESLWTALGDADASRARVAMAELAQNPNEAVALIAERLNPASALPADRISGWLKDLSHAQFAKRETATQALAALGDRVELHLSEFLATDPPPEARLRAERLLKALPPIPSSETLRRMRAVPVLAWADSPEARAILKRLAAGDPMARETVAARAALRGK
jgi:WD40 repeat protein